MLWKWAQSDTARAVGPLALLLIVAAAWWSGAGGTALANLVADARYHGPNDVTLDFQTQNYYQGLLAPQKEADGSGGWTARLRPWMHRSVFEPQDWSDFHRSGAIEQHPTGYLFHVLKPDYATVFKGIHLKINHWGERDRDYTKTKPPGTFRIALVGASNDLGVGVEEPESYASLLEERLNRELAGGAYARYEVMNFSVGGYHLLERIYVVEHQVPAFEPDVVLVVVTMHDLLYGMRDHLVRRIREDRPLEYDFLEEIAAKVGSEPDNNIRLARRVQAYRGRMLDGCLGVLRRFAENTSVPVAIVALRLNAGQRVHPLLMRTADAAEDAGLPVLRLYESYEGRTPDEMHILPNDGHPSRLAHRLLADELFRRLRERPGLLKTKSSETREVNDGG